MKPYSLKKQVFYLFSGKVAGYIIASCLPLIMVRLLSTQQFGVYRQILFVAVMSISLIRLRIIQSLYYFYPREPGCLGRLLSQTIGILSVAGCAGVFCLMAITLWFNVRPSGVTAAAVLPLAVYVLIETIAQIIDHIFILDEKSGLVFVTTVASNITRLVMVAGTFVVFRTVLSIVYALIVLALLRLGVVMLYLCRSYIIRPLHIEKALFFRQINYITPLALGSLAGFMATQVAKCVISGYMTPEDFAVFSVGSIGMLSILSILYVSIGNVCFAKFGELAVADNLSAAKHLWHRMVLVNALFTVPAVVFCWIFADKIIGLLFTARYLQSAWIWRINMLSLPVLMLGYGYIPRAFGETRAVMAANIASLIFSVPAAFLLITKFGLAGAATATVMGIWINALVQLRSAKLALKVNFLLFLPWKKLADIFIVSTPGVFFLVYLNSLDVQAVWLLFIGALVYFPLVWVILVKFNVIELAELKHLFFRKRCI